MLSYCLTWSTDSGYDKLCCILVRNDLLKPLQVKASSSIVKVTAEYATNFYYINQHAGKQLKVNCDVTVSVSCC